MPTYEYRCPAGHDVERFYKTISTAPAEVECPECGAMAARRLSAGGGLLFKGSGFYLTDYGKNAHRGGGKPAGAGSESSGSEAPASKGEPKADAPKRDAAKTDAPKGDAAKKAEAPKTGSSKPKTDK